MFARYDRLLLQSSLDLMADVVYCPRPGCQTPVMQEPGCTMGICSRCNYAFCTLCKMTYHGVSPCKVTAGESSHFRNGLEAVRCCVEKAESQELNEETRHRVS